MARRPRTAADKIKHLNKLVALVSDLPHGLSEGTVGEHVSQLVAVQYALRDLGASIGTELTQDGRDSGRARLIAYLRHQVGQIVHTDELLIVAAIGDYPRRVRELRTKYGWPVISGMAVRDLRTDALTYAKLGQAVTGDMSPEEYLLLEDRQDPAAVNRWRVAAEVRNSEKPLKEKLSTYLRQSVGERITAEELRYVAEEESHWPAVLRELVAEGWDIVTESSGEVPFGIFILRSA